MQEEAQGFHAVSQHLRMATSPEALRTRYFGDFYGGVITSAWSIINSIYRPSPLSGEWGGGGGEWGWEFQTPNHGLAPVVTGSHPWAIHMPCQSHLITMKDASVTQEIPEGLGTLCRERGLKTK